MEKLKTEHLECIKEDNSEEEDEKHRIFSHFFTRRVLWIKKN